MMKSVNKQNKHYTWVPARVSPEVQDQISNVAQTLGVHRHQVIAASLKAGLSLAEYQFEIDQVKADKGNRLN